MYVGELELLGGGLPTRLFTCTCYFMGFLSYIVRATHAQAALEARYTLPGQGVCALTSVWIQLKVARRGNHLRYFLMLFRVLESVFHIRLGIHDNNSLAFVTFSLYVQTNLCWHWFCVFNQMALNN